MTCPVVPAEEVPVGPEPAVVPDGAALSVDVVAGADVVGCWVLVVLLVGLEELLPASVEVPAGTAAAGPTLPFTCCTKTAELLVIKLPSPLYVAVMLWLPFLSDEVVKTAWRLLLSVAVPRMVLPSLKVTVPVGVPEPGALALTVAVKVTACPSADGLSEEVRVVAVASLLTDSLVLPELVVKLLSPL